PSKDCLKNLTAYANNNSYIGPIVLDTKQEDKLSFSLRLANSLQVFESYSQVLDYLHNEVNIPNVILPFNGTFIARELIQKIGLPHKCYFIWGDEREYTLRAKKYNADIFTVSSAIFYHPADSSSSIPMFFGKLRFNYANSDLKQYCFCRNTIAMFKEHQGLHYSFAFLIKTLWFFIFTKPNFKKLKLACRAMWHGLRNDFSHHREYL
ncbi:MAG: hypothetical protein Q4C75_07315, partial [Bergeyella zoohelcum]|nr:hypothetical protein [Bergeyella zoohelcum]